MIDINILNYIKNLPFIQRKIKEDPLIIYIGGSRMLETFKDDSDYDIIIYTYKKGKKFFKNEKIINAKNLPIHTLEYSIDILISNVLQDNCSNFWANSTFSNYFFNDFDKIVNEYLIYKNNNAYKLFNWFKNNKEYLLKKSLYNILKNDPFLLNLIYDDYLIRPSNKRINKNYSMLMVSYISLIKNKEINNLETSSILNRISKGNPNTLDLNLINECKIWLKNFYNSYKNDNEQKSKLAQSLQEIYSIEENAYKGGLNYDSSNNR